MKNKGFHLPKTWFLGIKKKVFDGFGALGTCKLLWVLEGWPSSLVLSFPPPTSERQDDGKGWIWLAAEMPLSSGFVRGSLEV